MEPFMKLEVGVSFAGGFGDKLFELADGNFRGHRLS
jgi:hypothetical protein